MDTSKISGRAQAELEYNSRPIPDQVAEIPFLKEPPKFTHAQFPGYVSKVQINTRGDMVFQITIPARWEHLAKSLFYATKCPLSIDIQHWSLADDS